MVQTVSQAKACEREEAMRAPQAVGEWIGHYSMAWKSLPQGMRSPGRHRRMCYVDGPWFDHEALQLCLLLLQSRPADLELIDLAAELLLNLVIGAGSGLHPMAIVLDPEGIGRHRRCRNL
jgi:hypothetical protein